MLTLTVLLLHLGTFGGLEAAAPAPEPVAPTIAMQTRSVDAAPVPVEPAAQAAAVASTEPAMAATLPLARPAPARATQRRPAAPGAAPHRVDPPVARRSTPADSTLSAADDPRLERRADAPADASDVVRNDTRADPQPGVPGLAPALVLALAASPGEPATASAAPAPVEEVLPHYRSTPPPPLTMRYELRRGMLHGNGELDWQPQGDHYDLKLTGRVGSLAVLTQTSTGGLDATGLAPLRFTDQRMTRAATAVNFQRAAGKISFSGPSTEYPLREGVQDRLSWMIQLASIVSAEPRLRVAGAKVGMWVVGSHGDAAVWMFRCVGPESVETPGGTVAALKFVRDARDAHDTNVQVWLDPQRYLLPIRASQQSGPRDDPFELRVESVTPTP